MTIKNSQCEKVTPAPAFQVIEIFVLSYIFLQQIIWKKNMYEYPLWKVFCVKMDNVVWLSHFQNNNQYQYWCLVLCLQMNNAYVFQSILSQ